MSGKSQGGATAKIISLADVRARKGLPAVAANTTPPATPGVPSDRDLWEMMQAMKIVDPSLPDSVAATRVLRAANRPRRTKRQLRDGSPRAPQRRSPEQGQVAPVPSVPEPATLAVPATPVPPAPQPVVPTASQRQTGTEGQGEPARAAQERTPSRKKRDKSRGSRKDSKGALSSYIAARVTLLVLMSAGGIAFLILSSILMPFGVF